MKEQSGGLVQPKIVEQGEVSPKSMLTRTPPQSQPTATNKIVQFVTVKMEGAKSAKEQRKEGQDIPLHA